ncbi:MAG: hypothetical protein K1X51_09080 [Rhodospirillaceae bacterium]|nr:hypothetical protein [Rhodospirillaceae bacterium]
MSSDIPIILAFDLQPPAGKPAALFLSAVSAPQMQQYATAGWDVMAATGFAGAKVDLAAVPARSAGDDEISAVTLLSCEAPHLNRDTAGRIARWRPAVVKINCAFHNIADAQPVADTLAANGYHLLGAHWRDDNSFHIRAVDEISPLSVFDPPSWDQLDIIAVRDAGLVRAILTLGRLYAGEEARILELRVGNMVRSDTIARLEDALVAHQPSDVFKLRK